MSASDPLSSWNEGEAKQSLIDFATRVSRYGWIIADMKNDWKSVFPATARSAQA